MPKQAGSRGVEKADWRPKALGKSFHDVAVTTIIGLSRGDFGTELKKYVQKCRISAPLDRKLIDTLYQHAYHCRQQVEAVRQMHRLVRGRDWSRRQAVFGFLRKRIDSFDRGLKKYRDAKLPLTDMLVNSITTQIVTFNKSVRNRLSFYAKMTANEKRLISGYLKPTVESQFLLDIFNILANRIRRLKVQERLSIVAGCAYAGKVLPRSKDETDFENLIAQRIHRARRALRRESNEFEWGRADDIAFFPAPSGTTSEGLR